VSIKGLALVVACVVLIGLGQILFKSAASQLRLDGGAWIALRSAASLPFVAALATYALATVLWMWALQSTPLSVAFPVYALTFVIVPILAHAFLGEAVGWRTFAGAAVIIAGVAISVGR
jgi:undecaprenyl phosphate-alpha-L-ara4N flippase subunit ArnE